MTAAEKLQGMTLSNGWRVARHLGRNLNATGGTFSQSYEVVKAGRVGFLKAFDFRRAFEPGVDTLSAIQILTSQYVHEKEVLEHCRDRRLSNVVLAIDHGEVDVPGMGAIEGRVFYLIFEMADGDVRCQMDISNSFDSLVCMRAIKDVTLGLWQVHKEMIAHQDPKPSNVLVYGGEGFKVADFGSSSRRGHPVHHDSFPVAGDRTYAPPELLYGFTHPDFAPRRMGCDLYMLGNLAAFLFSGVNITANLLAHVAPQHHPRNWQGSYDEVLPYLQNAFTLVLEDLSPLVEERVRSEIVTLVGDLCTPDLARRGHPKGVGRNDQFSLERYVSRFDVVVRRLQFDLRLARPAL